MELQVLEQKIEKLNEISQHAIKILEVANSPEFVYNDMVDFSSIRSATYIALTKYEPIKNWTCNTFDDIKDVTNEVNICLAMTQTILESDSKLHPVERKVICHLATSITTDNMVFICLLCLANWNAWDPETRTRLLAEHGQSCKPLVKPPFSFHEWTLKKCDNFLHFVFREYWKSHWRAWSIERGAELKALEGLGPNGTSVSAEPIKPAHNFQTSDMHKSHYAYLCRETLKCLHL